MNDTNDGLAGQLAKESGLTRKQCEKLLMALAARISEDLETSGVFSMPGVGNLTRAKAKAQGGMYIKVATVSSAPLGIQGSSISQGTGIPPALSVYPDIKGKLDLTDIDGISALMGKSARTPGRRLGGRVKKDI